MSAATPLPTSLAATGQQRIDLQWATGRFHGIFDRRDVLLSEAIKRLESKRTDHGFATVTKVSPEILAPAVGAGTVSGTITGTSFLGNRLAKASKTIGSGNAALAFEAVVPGLDGNDIQVTIEDTGALTVTVTDNLIEITHDGDTATAIAAAVNADADAKYLVNVTAGGTGGSVPDDVTTAVSLTGGTGPSDKMNGIPLAATILCAGGFFFRPTNWTDTAITVDVIPDDYDGEGTDIPSGHYPITLIVDGYAQFIGVCSPRQQKSLPIDVLSGVADGGTWGKVATSGGLATVTRTAADAAASFWIPLPHIKTGDVILGVDANYSVNTADLADVRFEVWAETQGADNASPTAAVIFGDDNADYDASHNTTAERGDDTAAPELHKIVVRDAGTPVVAAAGKIYKLRVYVDGDAGAAGVFVLKNAVLILGA